ncbi:MAG: hypothetical protein H0W62_12635 [Chitinophagales bacterium]|nr:hypothetical protein [Chitinophagales bacterium]
MKNCLHFLTTLLCCLVIFVLSAGSGYCYTVTGLKATFKSGQVFLTWVNPSFSNLKYKIYRSTSKITSSIQITSSAYLGYVMDNSSKNIRKSKLENKDYFFVTNAADGPLKSNQGLYVATSIKNKQYYYAVTVVTLNDDKENKTIVQGSNSLSKAVSETIEGPQPVLQQSETLKDGTIQYEYVNWGDNQDAPGYPAFNNCGSYGYNFSVFKHGSGKSELFVLVKDDNPFEDASDLCSDCSVLKPDDWLPNENNTYWVGYNDQYDIYSASNPVFTTGIIKTYTQARMGQTLKWARLNLNVDSNKVYITGTSHNGFGAMFTGQLNTDQIAAVYGVVPPILIKAENGSSRERQWCDNSVDLPTDITDPRTNEPVPVWKLFDNRFMDRLNYDSYIPFMGGVNGKNDITVGWVQKFHWYDSLNATRAGGTWYWDQRDHGGDGSQFTPDETKPDYERYAIHKSYPAFAYCSINQNPGDGDSKNGDPYGAINGYLDWEDGSLTDEACSYAVTCFVKDFYVGGKLDKEQYKSCTSDITLRRVQKFKPGMGEKISWAVKKEGNEIQSGSFTYYGGAITLYGVKIYKSKSDISLKINKCSSGKLAEDTLPDDQVKVVAIPDGYQLVLNLPSDDYIRLDIFDMSGKLISSRIIEMMRGLNSIPVFSPGNGVYVALMQGNSFNQAVKLNFMK